MTTHELCTYFDSGYLSRALVLHSSLIATGADIRLTALCLDDDARAAIDRLECPTLRGMGVAELERYDSALLEVKPTRSAHEYYFTLGPSFMRYLFERDGLDHLTYLDADMCFYANPEPLFEESADASVVLVGHRFPERLRHLEETGRFNVAWVGFANDADGRACLDWWRERCLEWCFDRVEEDRYADQRYLDQFPSRFARVHELRHPGADVAPWNVADPPLAWDGGRFMVGARPLIFFHFQGMRLLEGGIIDPHLSAYGAVTTRAIRRLYRTYHTALASQSAQSMNSPRHSTAHRAGTVRRWVRISRGLARRELITWWPSGRLRRLSRLSPQ